MRCNTPAPCLCGWHNRRRGTSFAARTGTVRVGRSDMTKETHCWGLSALTRHSLRNADAEIAHLEKALAADGTHSIFAQTYWRNRLYELHATPGLGIPQRIKLEKLLDILERHEGLQK